MSEKTVGWAWQVLSNLVSYGLEISQDIHDEAQKAACHATEEKTYRELSFRFTSGGTLRVILPSYVSPKRPGMSEIDTAGET